MGNRAIIKAKGNDKKAVYLHWNGGRDSVEAFLKYCELRGFRGFETDYGMARFVQVVSNFFGADGLSIGIVDGSESAGDNGVYIVDGWEIVGREDFQGIEQQEYDMTEMLLAIDEAQPESQQLGDYITADEVLTKTIKIGDIVYLQYLDGTFKKYKVIGVGKDKFVNGINVLGLPFVDKYGNGDCSNNINNYIITKTVKKYTNKKELNYGKNQQR
jgi:hypothetical protein